MNIAIVVPTIREKLLHKTFIPAWTEQIKAHKARLIVVVDGNEPTLTAYNENGTVSDRLKRKNLRPNEQRLIYDHTDAVRNLGFLYLAGLLDNDDIIVTLDDDVTPCGDTIGNHAAVLRSKLPISWMPVGDQYTRGFPYAVRAEAEVTVSHGVWKGIHDYDAPTSLVNGNKPMQFYRGAIPKGVLAPICGMNLAFRASVLPLVYYAPMGAGCGFHRFSDIWMGIELKRALDDRQQALATGYSTVWHNRQSNMLKNLVAEAPGIVLNETYWQAPSSYQKFHQKIRRDWEAAITARER